MTRPKIVKLTAATLLLAIAGVISWRHYHPTQTPQGHLRQIVEICERVRQLHAVKTSSEDRMARENVAMDFLKNLDPQEMPRCFPDNSVMIATGTWQRADQTTRLGIAELFATYYHAGGNEKRLEVRERWNSAVLARENADGSIQLESDVASNTTPAH